MTQLHYIPSWFFGFNIAFEMIFMLAAALVALYSYRIYKISSQKEIKLFGISFALLSASYFVSSIISLFFISALEGNLLAIAIHRILNAQNIAVASYILFLILGHITLLYTTLRVERKRIYGLLIAMAFIAINFSFNKVFMIYFISSLCLLFVNYHYYMEFIKRKNKTVFLTFWGMFFLFVSNVIFLVQESSATIYVISHVTELIGYCFIASSLLRVIKHGKKKK
ncbi:hypothetical protein J4402_05765 [Candidatus Pacearchaeota archaeon]|nr:hypothetical protein [Candidatus Pacearchaeota archaeon]